MYWIGRITSRNKKVNSEKSILKKIWKTIDIKIYINLWNKQYINITKLTKL